MAIRKRLYHPDEVRQKIKTSLLVNRLNRYALGKVEMSKGQVTAALGLLRKTMPDLSTVDMTVKGDKDAPIALELKGSDVNG